MNKGSVFLAAVWAGMATPASVYATNFAFRPLINDLTFGASFALVGLSLSEAMASAGHVEGSARTSTPGRAGRGAAAA